MTFIPAVANSLEASNGQRFNPFGHDTFVTAPLNTRPYADNASQESRIITHVITFDTTQVTSKANRSNPRIGDPSHPLTGKGHPPTIAFSTKDYGADAGEVAPTMRSMPHHKSHPNGGGSIAIAHSLKANSGRNQIESNYIPSKQVRRLTVVECCRLQGFPDTFLHIPGKRRKITEAMARYLAGHNLKIWQDGGCWYTDTPADGPMYRVLGNSMAVPVMRWLLNRIREVDQLLNP